MSYENSTEGEPGRAVIQRQIDEQHHVLMAHGQFQPLFETYLEHVQRWDQVPDPFVQTLMRQGLAGAALFLSCRARDEIVGWTLNLQMPPTNVFFTGDAGKEVVTGRAFKDGVDVTESSRLFVQSWRSRGEPSKSVVAVDGLDVLAIFEQYYDRSEQQPARFFDYDDGSYAMIVGLPGCDAQWMAALDRDRALDHLQKDHPPLETRSFRFHCGCSPDRLLQFFGSLDAAEVEDVFQDDERLEAQCPRCGRSWWVNREDLRSGPE